MNIIYTLIILLLISFSSSAQTIYCDKIDGEIIINKEYLTISYSKLNKIPNYVGYYITPTFLYGDAEREPVFYSEPLLPKRYQSRSSDYTRSGYDRGHMSPAADWRFSADAMHDSFSMANICPQCPELNRLYWKSVEDAERYLARRCDTLFVISGEICTEKKYIRNGVRVPTQFWKTVVGVRHGKVTVTAAWLFDNIKDSQPEEEHRTTIQAIEELIRQDLYYGYWFNCVY